MLLLRFFFLFVIIFSLYPPALFSQKQTRSDQYTISVVNHGWHTGIVIPHVPLSETIWPQQLQKYPFLEIGWGDAGFYQAQEITAPLVLEALLWPTESVLHLVGVDRSPQHYFQWSKVIELRLSHTEFQSLITFIQNTFDSHSLQTFLPLQKGLYGDSYFFRARPTYHLFYTCNMWTAQALQIAGVSITYFFMFTANDVVSALENQTEFF